GIERDEIEEWRSMRLVNDFAPKQIRVDARDEIVALQAPSVVERTVLEARRSISLLVEPAIHLRQPRLAPVWELAVELVLAKLNREVGMQGEIVGQEVIDEGVPLAGIVGALVGRLTECSRRLDQNHECWREHQRQTQ